MSKYWAQCDNIYVDIKYSITAEFLKIYMGMLFNFIPRWIFDLESYGVQDKNSLKYVFEFTSPSCCEWWQIAKWKGGRNMIWSFIPDGSMSPWGEWRQALECHAYVTCLMVQTERRMRLSSFKKRSARTNGRNGASSSRFHLLSIKWWRNKAEYLLKG